jgi:hypothetical protein
MAIGSGLGSSFGVSAESTYGTYVAPTKFLRAKSYMIEKVANRQQGEGIQSGSYGPIGAQFVETTTAASGKIDMDVQSTKMGVLLNTLMGGTTTPSASGAAYTAVFTLGDTYGKSLTAQLGAPYRSGTVLPHTLTGGKVAQASFSCDTGGVLAASFDVDGRAFTTTQTLASVSYSSANVFHFSQMSLKLGTYNSESSVSGVRSVGITIDRPHDVEDYTAGASGLKTEPVLNGLANITVDITADWLNKTTFQDLAHGTTATSLVWEFVGPTLAATNETFRITLPSVYFDPSTQGVDGTKELSQSFKAVWRYDGTNLPTITTISSDSTL